MATRKKKNNIGAFGHPIYGKGFAKYGEMRTNGSSKIPNDLEKAARKYQEGVPVDTTIHYCGADEDVYFANRIVESFIAGAKWQKEQIMKNAKDGWIDEECVIVLNDGTRVDLQPDYEKKPAFEFEYAQDVRVIVLPKED